MADLVSYADLKALLSLEETVITAYPDLVIIRDGVTAAIANYTGRYITEEDNYTESGLMVGQSNQIPLQGLPIVSVTSVTIDGSTYSSDNYKVGAYGLRLTAIAEDFEWSVTYVGGFDEWPNDLKRAALLQTAYEYQNVANIGAEHVSTDGGSVSLRAKPFTAEVERLLNSYIHISRIAG